MNNTKKFVELGCTGGVKVKCDVCGTIDEDYKLMLCKFYNPERMQCIGCSAGADGATLPKKLQRIKIK